MAEVPVSILLTLYGRCFKGSVERLNGQRRTSGAPVAAPAAEPGAPPPEEPGAPPPEDATDTRTTWFEPALVPAGRGENRTSKS